MNKRITIVTFSPIGKGAAGAGQFDLRLGKLLYENNCLNALICPSYNSVDLGLTEDVMVTPPSPLFIKLIYKIIAILGQYTGIKTRRYKEVIFDFFLSRNKVLYESDIVIFTKPAFKMSSMYCSNNGIKTIFIASILHPRFNCEIVNSEMDRLGVREYSEYADEKRTNYLSDFISTVSHVLVQSEMVKDNYVKHGVVEKNIEVLKSSVNVDLEMYKPGTDKIDTKRPFRVLHISNMDLIKGIDYLLSAWDYAALQDAELILGGSVNQGLEVVFDKHVMRNVNLLGYVDDTVELYVKSDIFVSPSVSDLNPFTVLEAMACGLPVIVSDNCGISAFIEHQVDGFVYRYNDVDELKSYINWCYLNRSAVKEMGRYARKKVLECSKNDVFTEVFRYIKETE